MANTPRRTRIDEDVPDRTGPVNVPEHVTINDRVSDLERRIAQNSETLGSNYDWLNRLSDRIARLEEELGL